MTLTLIAIALFVLGCFALWAAARAPVGWEDSDGFHTGEPDIQADEWSEQLRRNWERDFHSAGVTDQ